MDKTFTKRFATSWLDSWNAHDLDRVMSHYTDDFEMSSPFIVEIAGESSGKLYGKDSVRQYWSEALRRIPDLSFKLICVFAGVDSVTIHYKRAGDRLAAEVFFFDASLKVYKAVAHYAV